MEVSNLDDCGAESASLFAPFFFSENEIDFLIKCKVIHAYCKTNHSKLKVIKEEVKLS